MDPAIRTVFVVDTLPPEIILEGGDFINLLVGQPYEDPGFKGVDRLDGEPSLFYQARNPFRDDFPIIMCTLQSPI